MKKEQKQIICEHLDRFARSVTIKEAYYKDGKNLTTILECVEHFKKDNNLLTNVSGWYLDDKNDSLRHFDFEKNIKYGINSYNEWFINSDMLMLDNYHPATQQQVEERIFPFFEKMYPKGTKIKSLLSGQHGKIIGDIYFSGSGHFSVKTDAPNKDNSNPYFMLMKDGILAEIIEENENDKAIKALNKAIELLMDKKKELEDGI